MFTKTREWKKQKEKAGISYWCLFLGKWKNQNNQTKVLLKTQIRGTAIQARIFMKINMTSLSLCPLALQHKDDETINKTSVYSFTNKNT